LISARQKKNGFPAQGARLGKIRFKPTRKQYTLPSVFATHTNSRISSTDCTHSPMDQVVDCDTCLLGDFTGGTGCLILGGGLMNAPISAIKPDESEIKKALEILVGPDSPVELRAIHKNRNRIDAGVFDHEHRQELVDAAIRLNKMGAAVYVTLNPIDPQLLSRYHNRIQESVKATATDANITRRRWLLVDIDPIRPKDTASTDEQLDQAKETAREIYKHLKSLGWHDPVVAESGNGMHLFYGVDLPNDDASRDLIKGVLNTLADQFDNKAISVDRSVFNAGRIVKLHGTVANKGDNTTLSPWRLSKIVKDQDPMSVVSLEQLHDCYPAQSVNVHQQKSHAGTFDLDSFLSRLGIPYEMDTHAGRQRYKLQYCPFNSDHGKNDAAIFQGADGKLGFKCQHNSCADKTWKDVRALVDGTERIKSVANAEEWEPAIQEWPVMDKRAYHGLAGVFVGLASENSEADPAAILITFLVRFAVEVGSGPTLFIGDTKHRARFAGVIVGASSKARKGTSGKPIDRLFGPIEGKARYSPGPFSSGEGIIHAVRDKVMKWDEKKQVEVIADPGIEDKRLFILDEEFAGAMAQTKREGNTLSMVIRNAWDNGNLDPLTKTSKTTATNAHVGWISHITTAELHSRLTDSETLNGFANRILWVCARRSKIVPLPEPMDSNKLEAIRQQVIERITYFRNQDFVKIVMGAEAREAWVNKYYVDLTKDNPGLIGCVINRAEAQVARLSMLYCLLDGKTTMSIDHLESALALWRYCEASARYIFHGRQTDGIAEKVLEALAAKPLTGTELFRLFNNNVRKPKLQDTLSELKASGQIIDEQIASTGKKPKTVWKIKELTNFKNFTNFSDRDPKKFVNSLNSLSNSKNVEVF